MKPVLLHPALRAFVALADHGTLSLAGQTTHRSPSAVSLQIATLEERLGRPLFQRGPRGMTLTPAGRLLLHHARQLLVTEGDALTALAALGLAGAVRFGMPQDFVTSRLATTLAAFRDAHAAVSVTAVVDRNSSIAAQFARGELDLAVLIGRKAQPQAVATLRTPTRWYASEGFRWRRAGPLPLVLVEPPCLFRDAAVQALERAGIRHQVAFASASVAGMWAAVQAGVGVTARMGFGAPPGVVDVTARIGTPALAPSTLSLVRRAGSADEAVQALSGLVAQALKA
jgi:DNA-binding transcriptional LysR family regulator